MFSFRYLRATSLDEALNLLQKYGSDARILAGGTDLLVNLQDGVEQPGYLIDIKPISEMHRIWLASDGTLHIGAGVTINRLFDFPDLPESMHAIRQAAGSLGSYQIRNRATVGGNICNASPACDLGPPLLVLGAQLRAVSKRGDRTIPIKEFFKGVKTTCLEPGEIITEIIVPLAQDTHSVFLKRSRIKGHDLAIVNAAGALSQEGNLRIALGAVAPRPLLFEDFDGATFKERSSILEVIQRSIAPIDDVRGSAVYRRYMVEVLVTEIIERLADRLDQG